MTKKSLIQLNIFGLEEKPYDPVYPARGPIGKHKSPRAMAFARYYFETNKKMESAVRAGYKEKNAHIIANRLIKDSLISNLIEEWREAAIKRSGVTKERALIELGRLATFDPRKMYQADGTLKNPKDWDDDVAAAVASLDVFEEFIGQGTRKELAGQTKKVKFWNKPESLKTLLQHLGLLVDKKEISGEFGMNHKGSVVLLPAKMSADEWADQFDNPPED